MSEGAKIIQITTEPKDCLPIKQKKKSYCSHLTVEIDEDERTLHCKQCDTFLDPFNFILDRAREERSLYWNKQQQKEYITKLFEEKERLMKDVTNLKNQKKRLL